MIKVKGIDLYQEHVEYGRKKNNLDLEIGSIENLVLDRPPNIIIYSHVLENILDLRNELKKIRNILFDEGVLYIEVPGVKNLKFKYSMNFVKYLQNTHTYHFTLTTLRNKLERNGFQMITGNEFVQSFCKKYFSYNRVIDIANDYESVMNFLYKL